MRQLSTTFYPRFCFLRYRNCAITRGPRFTPQNQKRESKDYLPMLVFFSQAGRESLFPRKSRESRAAMFDEAYNASDSFKAKIPQAAFEQAKADLSRELPAYPEVWAFISQPLHPNDPLKQKIIALRQAYIYMHYCLD